MEINKLEDAKKYIDKELYFLDEEKNKPVVLYVGGVNLHFNRVNYDITGFSVFCDKGKTDYWGDVIIEDIKDKFVKDDFRFGLRYTFSKSLAEETLPVYKKYKNNLDKENAIESAKTILDREKIKYEIFD
jgi:hypothetical protein